MYLGPWQHLREHQQKTFVMLSRFWPLRGLGNLSESVKMENFVMKFVNLFFSDMLNEVLQMISSNVKANLKFFYKKYPQNLKYNVKRAYIFHLILVGIPSSMILSVKRDGRDWSSCLMQKICWVWQKLFVDGLYDRVL